MRIIYLDEDRAASFIKRLTAAPNGRQLVAAYIKVHSHGTLGEYNAALLLAQLAAAGEGDSAITDLGQGVGLNDTDLHPSQILAWLAEYAPRTM
jgi:hypothetical protein